LNILQEINKNPILAAASNENIDLAVSSNVSAIILMNTNLNELMTEEFQINNIKKPIFLHTDLIKGLSNDKEAINFIIEHINPSGIVSTKSSILRAAKKKSITTIQRIFIIDSSSLNKSIESILENDPDLVEMMPAFAYPIVDIIKKETNKPIILGGLVKREEQIFEILESGADGVSCSAETLWNTTVKKKNIF
jgi:glycerol uptake operon antiterminator